MSSTNRKQAAKAHDKYPTPVRLVRAAFDQLLVHRPRVALSRSFLEPGAHAGAFCQVADLYCRGVKKPVGVDPYPPVTRHPYTLVQKDFLQWKTRQTFDFIATNPPFRLFEEFLLKSQSLLNLRGTMLYLMRLSVLGSKKRREFWPQVQLNEVWVVRPRPSFQKEGGSDSSEYAFFVFDRPSNGGPNPDMYWLDW